MPPRQLCCCAGVEPRLFARPLRKNLLPASSPPRLVSVVGSAVPREFPLPAPARPPAPSTPSATGTAPSDAPPVTWTIPEWWCNFSSVPPPSPESPVDTFRFAFPLCPSFPCKVSKVRLSHFWGSLHSWWSELSNAANTYPLRPNRPQATIVTVKLLALLLPL